MIRRLQTEPHVVVVDSRPPDYCDLTSFAAEHRWHIHFLTSARAAITFARRAHAELWLINGLLPDMSGFALLEALKDQFDGAAVLIISDQYDANDERSACESGAHLYLSKSADRLIECRPLLLFLMAHAEAAVDQEFGGPGMGAAPAVPISLATFR